MKKKILKYSILFIATFILASARIWIPLISDYRNYHALFGSAIVKELDKTVWLVQENFTRTELSETETYNFYSIMREMENVHVVFNKSKKTYTMHVLGTSFKFRVRFYEDQFQIGDYIYATSDNYDEIYNEIEVFFQAITAKNEVQ